MMNFKTQILETEEKERFSNILSMIQKKGIPCSTRRTDANGRMIYRIYVAGTDYPNALNAIYEF